MIHEKIFIHTLKRLTMQIYPLEKQIDGIPNYNQGPPGDFYVQTPLYVWVRMHVYKKWNSSIGKSVESSFFKK